MASMTACVMDAIYRIVHVYRTYSCYSHSMVAGGLEVQSSTTRLI